jgi:hypothetical protein
MRCDRVGFDLGPDALRIGTAGTRRVVKGTLELNVEREEDRVMKAGEVWFESGREPVYARASPATPMSFIRCSILPRQIRGQSSIMYVDPKDAGTTLASTPYSSTSRSLPR